MLAARVHDIVAAAVRRAAALSQAAGLAGGLETGRAGHAILHSANTSPRSGWRGITCLNSVGSTLVSVCRDVGGIQAQVMSAAELSLWTRRRATRRADVQAALWQRRELVKTTSMRMTLHLAAGARFPDVHRGDEGVVAWRTCIVC